MKLSRNLVIKKIDSIFGKKNRKKILNILDMYGTGNTEPFKEQVQLASLKLCQENMDKLKKIIAHAKVDHYDIIFPAEEPNLYSLEKIANQSADEIARIQEEDRKQYLDWLNE